MNALLNRLALVLRQPDGIAEAVGLSALLVAASLGLFVNGIDSTLTALSTALLVVWGLVVAPLKPAMATGIMLLVCIGAFLVEGEAPGLVAVGLFLVVEVLFANSHWITGAVLAVASTIGFGLTSDWVLGVAGFLIALSVALIRRQLILLQEHQRSQVELELSQERIEISRQLHDHLANSLTRVVLLAEQPSPDSAAVAQEARHSVDSLHQIMRRLRKAEPIDEHRVPLAGVIEEGTASLNDLGYKVTSDIDTQPGSTVVPAVADSILEMFTNAMKHGASPIRIIAETDRTEGRILLVNGLSEAAHSNIAGTGSGVTSITDTSANIGGSYALTLGEDTARAVFEFPVVPGGVVR